MSIQTQLQNLATNKANIKAAIEAKNPTIAPTNALSQWPTSIASISVQKVEQSKTVTPTSAGFTVTPDSGKALSSVVVNGDSDLVAGNIKKDVEIFGVTGTYEGSGGGFQGYNFTCQAGSDSIQVLKTDGTVKNVSAGQTESDVVAIHLGHTGYSGEAWFNGSWIAWGGYDNIIYLTADSTAKFKQEWDCVLKDTMITLHDLSEKPVQDITFDDELLVWDFDNGCLSRSKPIWIKRKEFADYYFVNKYKSGKELLTTGQSETGWGHRTFDLNKNKFIYTTESVSDTIYTLDGIDTHMSCTRVEEPCEFYNIMTERHINLFANRILTSCSLNNIYPVENMRFVKDDRVPRNQSDYDGIPYNWFLGLRLAENMGDIAKMNKYVHKLMRKNNA